MTRAPRTLAASLTIALVTACEREGPRPVRAPREAMGQLIRCTLDGVGAAPPPGRLEGEMRQALRHDRAHFAERAGTCESALETEGGAHACVARLRSRWAEMLTVVQRPSPDAIDQDVAVRRVSEAYIEDSRDCP